MTLATTACLEASDLGLVRRAQSGERPAFDALVTKYRSRVVKLAMRYTHNLCDAEDAAQEAFVSAYRGLPRFRCESSFYTWLHRIAINSARNILIARRREALVNADALQGEEIDEIHDRLPGAETPENLAQAEELRRAVRSALISLPESQRLAVMMREIDGLTYQEIALVVRAPPGTVRSRIYRAREFIDRQLRLIYPAGLGRCDGRY